MNETPASLIPFSTVCKLIYCSSSYQRNQEQYDKNEEQNFRYACRPGCYSAKSEDTGNDSDYQKNYSPS
jgi:hypothetical protein